MTQEALTKRIEEYLSAGGLFNPELANHVAVRDLLIECREALRENAMREVQRLGQEIEQEPIGTVKELFTQTAWERLDLRGSTKVYLNTTPPQRTWVGLTDEEKSELWEISRAAWPRYITYASLAEAKLKERNT